MHDLIPNGRFFISGGGVDHYGGGVDQGEKKVTGHNAPMGASHRGCFILGALWLAFGKNLQILDRQRLASLETILKI